MTMKKPTGPKRPRKPTSSTDTHHVPVSRSYAVVLRRSGEQPSLETMVKRQAYWANRLKELDTETDYGNQNDNSTLGHYDLPALTEFETANVESATLDNVDANEGPVEAGNAAGIAGLDTSTGAIPPPPPTSR